MIWACGYSDFIGTVLLKITGNKVEKVYQDIENWYTIRQDSISGVITSLWTDDSRRIYLVTPAGLYSARSNTSGEASRSWLANDYLPGFPRRLRGQGRNDLIIVGDFTFVAHYNGLSWRYYEELKSRIRFRSLDYKDDLVIAVGLDLNTGKAITMFGRRY